MVLVPILFPVARAVVVAALAIRGHVRRHLRWQLTLSHLAVIVLTFAAMTAVGSLIANSLKPNSEPEDANSQ